MSTSGPEELTSLWRSNANPHIFLANASSELVYALQPIIDARTGKVYGYEALLRNVARLGFATPFEVFDFAHKNNCLRDLELLLRRKAIEKFATVSANRSARLFLNVDVRILENQGGLLAETAGLLARHGLMPADVCIELAETFDSASNVRVEQFVADARAMGFAFAIDDFGRGYSQLKVLYEYEIDIIKIDRFFISNIQTNARKRLFVSTVVDLAHTLGMKVVAEGVETAEEFGACRSIGCDLVQGYYVARPSTAIDHASYGHVLLDIVGLDEKKSDIELIKREIRPLETVIEGSTMTTVLDLLRRSQEVQLIPVLSAQGEPRGLIRELDLREFLYLPHGQDLLRNRSIPGQMRRFQRRCPVADIGTRLDRLIDLTSDDTVDGVIITRNGEYFGFLTIASLLKMSNEIRLREATDQNPLTKLPGNSTINGYVAQEAKGGEVDRVLCYIDFDNFKPYNDSYGFRNGDRAIVLFSELLKRKLGASDGFVGHVGGDDFFIGSRNGSLQAVEARMAALRAAFRHEAESLYEPGDRLKGFIEASDRHGVMRRFPLLSVSIAILHLPRGLVVENPELLGRKIAKLKSAAKASVNGIVSATFGDDIHNAAVEEPETIPELRIA